MPKANSRSRKQESSQQQFTQIFLIFCHCGCCCFCFLPSASARKEERTSWISLSFASFSRFDFCSLVALLVSLRQLHSIGHSQPPPPSSFTRLDYFSVGKWPLPFSIFIIRQISSREQAFCLIWPEFYQLNCKRLSRRVYCREDEFFPSWGWRGVLPRAADRVRSFFVLLFQPR
jgi:hypothetical protein